MVLTFACFARLQVFQLKNPLRTPLNEADRDRLPLKVDSICHRLNHNPWKDSLIEAEGGKRKPQKGPPLLLTRDGIKFPVIPEAAHLFYVLNGDSGLELIHVEKTLQKVTDDDAEKLQLGRVSSGKLRKEWCVVYNRVLSTKDASDQSTPDDYREESGKRGARVRTSLGSASLRRLLSTQSLYSPDTHRLTFHKGDYPFESAAKNIVGFVAWDTEPTGRAHSVEECKMLLGKVNAALSKAAPQGALKIKSLDEIDWVFCGQDFSECPPLED